MFKVPTCAFLKCNQYLENMKPTEENFGFGENFSYGIELFQVSVDHNWPRKNKTRLQIIILQNTGVSQFHLGKCSKLTIV